MKEIQSLIAKLDNKLDKLALESALLLLQYGSELATPLAIERRKNVEWKQRIAYFSFRLTK
jgi:hypothetical protein